MFYNTKKTLNRIATIIAMGAIVAFVMPNTMLAQMVKAGHFENTGTYEDAGACPLGGAIVMKGSTVVLTPNYPGMPGYDPTKPTITLEDVARSANGFISGNGVGAGNTGQDIVGKVVWAKQGNQDVQEGLQFTHLYVSGGGVKTFGKTKVRGIFDYWGLTPDDPNTGTAGVFISHLCDTFTYNGLGPDAQTILYSGPVGAGGVSNWYTTLHIKRPSTLPATEIAATTMVQASAILVETGVVNLAGTLNLVPTTITGCAPPPSKLDDTLRIADCDAELLTVAGIVIEVRPEGALTNDCPRDPCTPFLADGTPNPFYPTCLEVPCNTRFPDGTTIVYYPGTTIMQVWENCAYSEIVIKDPGCDYDESGAPLSLAGDIYVDKNFKIEGAGVLETKDNTVWFTGANAGMDFVKFNHTDCANDRLCGEVIGWIGRINGIIPASNTVNGFGPAGKTHYFHNTGTILSFAGYNTPGGYSDNQMNWFRMRMIPDLDLTSTAAINDYGSKAKIETNFGHIRRLVQVEYAGNLGSIATMNIGYRKDELKYGTSSPTGENEFVAKLRGFEAHNKDVAMWPLGGNDGGVMNLWLPNMTTPAPITASCDFFVKRQTSPILLNRSNATGTATGPYDIAHSNQIVFTDQPIWFVSKNNGRWSNPDTWVQGTTPTATDHAELRHIVYTGFSDDARGNLFGMPQYSRAKGAKTPTSENKLPGTYPTEGPYAVTLSSAQIAAGVQKNTLADTVRMVYYAGTTPATTGALVIGNYAKDEINGTDPADMDMKVPLRFNVIQNFVHNNHLLGSNNHPGGINAIINTVDRTEIGGAENGGALHNTIGGVVITNCTGVATGPVLNGVYIDNRSKFTNRSILSLGIGNNDLTTP